MWNDIRATITYKLLVLGTKVAPAGATRIDALRAVHWFLEREMERSRHNG